MRAMDNQHRHLKLFDPIVDAAVEEDLVALVH